MRAWNRRWAACRLRACRRIPFSASRLPTACGTRAVTPFPTGSLSARAGCRAFPDAVAFARSEADVRSAFALCRQLGAALIPYGGGTSVVGHINPLPDGAPTITLDLSHLHRLLALDETNHLATFEAGVRGPDLEEQLAARGYTLGHFPQSFELSTLGGWIATRSCGQQSYYYGRIEDLFCGGHVESPAAGFDLPPLPASAAGPDLRQLLLGSEGRMGVITRAQVRVRRRPETESFYGVFFADWAAGAEAVREMAQSGLPVSMMRLSDAQETETTLMLAGKPNLTRWADRGLRLAGYRGERSLLILGITGDRRRAGQTLRHAAGVCRRHGGLFPIAMIGRMWHKSRFLSPYLRNTLWERGYALDTVETALPWANALSAARTIQQTLRKSFTASGRRLLVFTHLSHIYADGASVYTTYLFPRADDPDETVAAWRAAKLAVESGNRQTRRDHQPPARRRSRPRAVSGGREGPGRHRRVALRLPVVRPRWHAQPGEIAPAVAARDRSHNPQAFQTTLRRRPTGLSNPAHLLSRPL